MGKYQKYPEYIDSKLMWMGEVPSHWIIVQSRRLFSQRKERARDGDQQLTASQKYGIIYQKEFMALENQRVMQVITGSEILKHIEKNDFVISMRSFQGGLELCQYPGCISSAYIGLIPIKHIVPSFFKYLFKCTSYIQALQSTSNLVRDGQALRYENFALINLPIIPENEQQKIADFLDYETAKIDTLIGKQQELIKLLKEKRQAVISHAVTKGLNPNAPMRDSGIEWLGEVPEHWSGATVKNFCYINDGNHGEEYPEEFDYVDKSDGVPFIRAGDFDDFRILDNDLRYISHTKNNSMRKGNLQEFDILFVNRGASIGKLCVIQKEFEGSNLNSQIAYLRPNQSSVDGRLLTYFLSSNYIQTKIQADIQGGALPQYPLKNISNLDIWFGPLEEQRKIADYLDNKVARIIQLCNKAQVAITLMQERRTALISAAVTGKIDVRDWVKPELNQA